MKKVIILRHSKSSWASAAETDFDRPLNDRGKRDAPMMGKRLLDTKVKPDIILLSTSRRTRQTAELLLPAADLNDVKLVEVENLYLASVGSITKILMSLSDQFHTAMVIAHNPGITDFVCEMSNARLDNMPTSGFAIIEFEAETWNKLNRGDLSYIDYPKKNLTLV
jgi:phosphohistidine phosphatase